MFNDFALYLCSVFVDAPFGFPFRVVYPFNIDSRMSIPCVYKHVLINMFQISKFDPLNNGVPYVE